MLRHVHPDAFDLVVPLLARQERNDVRSILDVAAVLEV